MHMFSALCYRATTLLVNISVALAQGYIQPWLPEKRSKEPIYPKGILGLSNLLAMSPYHLFDELWEHDQSWLFLMPYAYCF